MVKKILVGAFLILLLAAMLATGLMFSHETAIRSITADTPCPAAGCASGACHGFDAVPSPDGVHEMTCPEAGCASAECHAWDSLTGRYHQASDMSLNMWILMPVALVLGLWLLVRRTGRGGGGAKAPSVPAVAEAGSAKAEPVDHGAGSVRPAGSAAMPEADFEEACHEA